MRNDEIHASAVVLQEIGEMLNLVGKLFHMLRRNFEF